ncbi:11982_t:CDS:2, partial [Ambispora gerdemannii]
VSLNNVYVCITYPTMFHCLAQAARVHVTNITSADRGLAYHAYKNISKTIDVGRFYAEHGVMSELANQMIKALEAYRDRYIEIAVPSSTTTVPSNIPHIKVSASTMFAADHSSTFAIPNNSFGPYSSPTSTHLSSPITDPGSRSPNIHHTPTFTYVQQPPHTQPATLAFLPSTVTSSAFGTDGFFSPTVSSTNIMTAVPAASDLGQGDSLYWDMAASVYSPPQHIQLRHVSPSLSNASLSSPASSASFKHHQSNDVHVSLDHTDDLDHEDI